MVWASEQSGEWTQEGGGDDAGTDSTEQRIQNPSVAKFTALFLSLSLFRFRDSITMLCCGSRISHHIREYNYNHQQHQRNLGLGLEFCSARIVQLSSFMRRPVSVHFHNPQRFASLSAKSPRSVRTRADDCLRFDFVISFSWIELTGLMCFKLFVLWYAGNHMILILFMMIIYLCWGTFKK